MPCQLGTVNLLPCQFGADNLLPTCPIIYYSWGPITSDKQCCILIFCLLDSSDSWSGVVGKALTLILISTYPIIFLDLINRFSSVSVWEGLLNDISSNLV